MRIAAVAGACAAVAVCLAGCGQKQTGTDGGKRLTIAVIPKGTTHEFWKSVEAGAKRAGSEMGVEALWIGPEKEDDRGQQIDLVNNMVLRRADAIVLAPLDKHALAAPVARAKAAGIGVVIIDSDLEGGDYVCFAATDNKEGGRKAGRLTCRLVGERGDLVMLRYAENHASTENREAGWLEVVREYGRTHPDVKVVSEEQRAGATKETAQSAAENLLDRFTRDGKLTVAAIFTPNESSTYGMLMALRNRRFAGKVRFVGFDASKPLIQALAAGEIDGLVVQNPEKMGYEGVKAAVAHIRGQPVPRRIDTGAALITKDDLGKPATKALVPNVDEWVR